MKKAGLTFIIFIFLNSLLFAQEKNDDLQLFDSFSEYNCEYLLYRLDSLLGKTVQSPNSIAYAVIHGDDNFIRNKFLENTFRNHIAFRRFDKNRFIVIPTKAENVFKIELWISKSGKTQPAVREEAFSYNLGKPDKPVLFVREMVEITEIDGRLAYLGDCAACCLETVNLYFLSEILKANPQMNAFIKIYGRSRNHTKKLEKLLRDEMVKEHKIPAERFRISYQGVDEEIVELPKNFATVEIEFVPNK